MLPPRMVCNVVYAHLIAAAQSDEDREKFDDSLYEPVDGGRAQLSLIQQLGG